MYFFYFFTLLLIEDGFPQKLEWFSIHVAERRFLNTRNTYLPELILILFSKSTHVDFKYLDIRSLFDLLFENCFLFISELIWLYVFKFNLNFILAAWRHNEKWNFETSSKNNVLLTFIIYTNYLNTKWCFKIPLCNVIY